MPSVGLIEDSTYELIFQNATAKRFFIAMFNKSEYYSIPPLTSDYAKQFCSRPKPHISRFNQTITVSKLQNATGVFSIRSSAVYYPTVVSCYDNTVNGKSCYYVSIYYMNGEHALDSRRIPSLITLPICFSMLGALLVIWIINNLYYRKGNNQLHHFISIALVLCTSVTIVKYIILRYDDIDYETSALTVFNTVIIVLYNAVLLATLILAAKGYCIVRSYLSTYEITQIIIFCVLYCALRTMGDLETFQKAYIIIYVFSAALLFLVWFTLIVGIRTVSKQIFAHLVVIAQRGIEPITTPIYRKYIIYSYFIHVVIMYFSGLVILISLQLADVLSYWSADLFSSLLNFFLLFTLGFMFRLKKTDCLGYTQIFGGENIDYGQIEPLESSFFEETRSLKPWQEGMMLPPQPTIVTNDKSICQQTTHPMRVTEDELIQDSNLLNVN